MLVFMTAFPNMGFLSGCLLCLAWRFAGAKPPYAYAIISVDFF